MFIKFNSGIDGEVNDSGYEKSISTLSWSHSFNQPTSPVNPKTHDLANHADFSFTKYLDSSSTSLIKACWAGRTIRTATFTICSSEGDRLLPSLQIQMENVIVSNVSIGGGSGDAATETVTLAYEKVTYSYFNARGSQQNSVYHDVKSMAVG